MCHKPTFFCTALCECVSMCFMNKFDLTKTSSLLMCMTMAIKANVNYVHSETILSWFTLVESTISIMAQFKVVLLAK